MVSCLPNPGVSEKWKLVVHHSKQNYENKGNAPPVLKAAGKGLNPVPIPVVTNTKEMTEMVKNTCDSKTSTLTEREQSAAAEAQAERSPVEVTEEAVVQVLERPNITSYFLPGKQEGRPVQFLIDTGCTTNLLSKSVFDQFPERIKSGLVIIVIMADGTQLSFYGVLSLPSE